MNIIKVVDGICWLTQWTSLVNKCDIYSSNSSSVKAQRSFLFLWFTTICFCSAFFFLVHYYMYSSRLFGQAGFEDWYGNKAMINRFKVRSVDSNKLLLPERPFYSEDLTDKEERLKVLFSSWNESCLYWRINQSQSLTKVQLELWYCWKKKFDGEASRSSFSYVSVPLSPWALTQSLTALACSNCIV